MPAMELLLPYPPPGGRVEHVSSVRRRLKRKRKPMRLGTTKAHLNRQAPKGGRNARASGRNSECGGSREQALETCNAFWSRSVGRRRRRFQGVGSRSRD